MNLEPITAPPSAAELGGRLERVRARMAEQGLDTYVSVDPVNVYYLTNFFNFVHERPFVLVVGLERPLRFVVPQLEESHVRARAACPLEIARYVEFPAPEGQQWYDRLAPLLPDRGRIGVEHAMPLGIFERIAGDCVVADVIDDARLVKTPYEIGRMVHACDVLNAGFEHLVRICRPGMTLADLQREVAGNMMRRTLEGIPHANPLVTSFKAIVQPPSLSDDPHNFTDACVRMEPGGPHVALVVGQVNGCGAEHERTFFLGGVPDAARDPFDAMLEGRRLAFARAIPGASMGAIDAAVRDAYRHRGYGEAVLHRTGHGLGITGHEAPFLAVGYDRPLAPGMVVSIEPGIYLPGIGGFRHSDTVLITDEGNVSLTRGPETLEALTFGQ
jgi:Xaa-Pro dipeptidase